TIDESTAGDQPAIEVRGGTVDLGTAADPGNNTINIHGSGSLIVNYGGEMITAVGNRFQQDGNGIAFGFAVEEEIQDFFENAASGAVLVYDDRYFDRTKTRVSDFDLQKLSADLRLSEPSFEILGNVAGTAILMPDNHTVRFTADSSGLSSFTFAVFENNATQAIRTVELDVTNVAPTAFNVQGAVNEDGPVVDLAADFADVDVTDVHTFSIDTTGTTGTVTNNGDGTFTYDPAGKFGTLPAGSTAADSFTYTVDDGNGGASTATVTVTIHGQNDPASISGVTAGDTDEDSAATTSGVLSVSDIDAGEAVFQSSSQAGTYGAFAIDASGSWSFVLDIAAAQSLNAGDLVTDSFTVQSIDRSATETVAITIEGLNDQAAISGVAGGQTNEDSLTNVTARLLVTDNDDGENQFVPLANSAGNFGSFSMDASGDWTYVLDSSSVQAMSVNEVEADSFTVRSLDGTATETVVVTIDGKNDAPVGSAESYAVSEDDILTIPVSNGLLANDTDIDRLDSLSVFAINGETAAVGVPTPLAYGVLTVQVDGSLQYQPGVTSDLAGLTETFTYTVTDGKGGSDEATVSIEILPAIAEGSIELTGGILRVGGTENDDVLIFGESNGMLTLNGESTGVPIAGVDEIRIWSRAGNDRIDLGSLDIKSMVQAGEGDDDVSGGSNSDLIFGGLGNDHIVGGSGNDFLVGGLGADRMVGSSGHDILMSEQFFGSTLRAEIDQLLDQWVEQAVESESTEAIDEIFSDEEKDKLTGGSGSDWFMIGEAGRITDLKQNNPDGDLVTEL
ncbi:VCBS domain-containing protein, partial [Stieleria sp.]|uniref:VCBS domain-containing protein n=1 Tax=Stieleria sp. TaxID=2795976 RepID=UPI00356775FD